MATDPARLDEARQLIRDQKYAEARAILEPLRGDETADRWLARLDEIAPVGAKTVPSAPPIPQPKPQASSAGASYSAPPPAVRPTPTPNISATAIRSSVQNWLQTARNQMKRATLKGYADHPQFANYVIGFTALFAFLTLLSFFLFSWVEVVGIGGGSTGVPTEVTAAELWLGNSDAAPTLDFEKLSEANSEKEREDLGFGDVRVIDRLLILIIFLAGGILAVAEMYRRGSLDVQTTLMILALLAFIMFVFPTLWAWMSTGNFRGKIEDSIPEAFRDDSEVDELVADLTEIYSLGEHRLFSGLAFLVSAGGLALYLANRRGMLGGSPAVSSPGGRLGG